MNLKSRTQSLLKRAGVYHRLRASRLYELYWKIVDTKIIEDLRAEVTFYRTLLQGLQHGDLIFDIGANEGFKTRVFLQLGAKVVAIDPDPHNQDILRQSFLKLRLVRFNVEIVSKAVSDKDAVETLWLDSPGSAKNTLSRKWVDILRADERRFGARLSFGNRRDVETVSLESLFACYGIPFFIKIDVEGHEVSVLRGLRQPVPYLSFEVNLPEFRSDGEECVELLHGLEPTGTFNYTADCRRGLFLKQWVSRGDFLSILGTSTEPSIEVFWRSP